MKQNTLMRKKKRRWAWVKRAAYIVACVLAIGVIVCCVVVWDHVRTLSSLRRVPNTKIYVMDYFADYNPAEIRDQGVNPSDVSGSLLKALLPELVVPLVRPFIPDDEEVTLEALTSRDHSCSTASIRAPDGRVLVGRNFDWIHDPCLVVRIHHSGRGSVAIVDPYYLGIHDTELDQISLRQRLLLLGAPYLVADGRNEHGVVIASMSCFGQEPEKSPNKPTVVQSAHWESLLRAFDHLGLPCRKGRQLKVFVALAVVKGPSKPVPWVRFEIDEQHNLGVFVLEQCNNNELYRSTLKTAATRLLNSCETSVEFYQFG